MHCAVSWRNAPEIIPALALEFFGQFLSSGYTHVQEMIDNTQWTVISHQVVKPMMVPQRFNYDENKSLVPNVFQCRIQRTALILPP